MPQKTCKTFDLDALARAVRVSLLGLAVALAGCQTTGQSDKDDSDNRRAIDVQFNPAWSSSYDDLWERMRSGFKLQEEIDTNPRIEQQRLWFMSNQSFVRNASQRGSPYIHYIVERLEERDMPLELALLPMIESAYNPMAVSPAQAVGLWQFIPATGSHFNLRQTRWYDGRRDITASTNAALTYLTRLHDMFNGDWLLALAAYNAGEGTVSRAIERNEKLGLPTDYWNLPLPQETQDYVPKLLALSQLIMAPDIYGVSLSPIANEPYFTSVRVKPGLDLSSLAALADLDEEELQQLNPAFKRGITVDAASHLLVPMDKADTLQAGLETLKPQTLQEPREVPQGKRYSVRKGDNLHSIAQRYRLTVAELKSANRLTSNRLSNGQVLIIPGQLEVAQPKRQERAQPTPVEKVTTYKVKDGDNLWLIAKRYKLDVADIKRWNALRTNDLKLGQELKLKGGTKTAEPTKDGHKNGKATLYTVRKGDSLHLIAQRFKVSLRKLQSWNPKVSKALKPGQILTLYLK